MRTSERRRTRAFTIDVVVAACAASAGVHAGLAPEHLREATQLGVAFIASVVLLAAAAAVLATHDESRRAVQAAALLLAGLIAAYVVSRTTGIPWLAPEAEPVDAVGVATKLVEVLGFLFALKLIQPVGGEPSSTSEEVRP
jgi:predicted tellurium resistance membrane protein TerC